MIIDKRTWITRVVNLLKIAFDDHVIFTEINRSHITLLKDWICLVTKKAQF